MRGVLAAVAIVFLSAGAAPAAADTSCVAPPVGSMRALGGRGLIAVPGGARILGAQGGGQTVSLPDVFKLSNLGGEDIPDLPGVGGSDTAALLAWRSSANLVRAATLTPDGALGQPVTVGTGASGPTTRSFVSGTDLVGPVLAGRSWVLWRGADGDHLVSVDRRSGAPGPGPAFALGDKGHVRLGFADDASGTAWVVSAAHGRVSAQPIPPPGPLKPIPLAGLAPKARYAVAADGRGGLYVLASSPWRSMRRLQLVHVEAGGSTHLASVKAPVAEPGGQLSVSTTDGTAMVAYDRVGPRRLNAYVRQVTPAAGRLGPEHALTRSRSSDEIVTRLQATGAGGGVIGMIQTRPGVGAPAAAVVGEFRARGLARLTVVSSDRRRVVGSVSVAHAQSTTVAAWTYVNPSSQTSFSGTLDAGALGRAVAPGADSGQLDVAPGICSGA